jgi:membrane protease YdiL (CAAX protease family)
MDPSSLPPEAPFPASVPYVPPDVAVQYAPVPPAPPRVWTVFVAFGVAMLFGAIVPAVVMLPLALLRFGREVFESPSADTLQTILADPVVFLPTIASTQLVLIGVAVCAAILSPVPWKQRLRLGPPVFPWHGYAVAVLGTVALGFGSSLLIELLGWGDEGALKMFSDALGGLRGMALVLAATVVGVAPGLGEEMLFRGYTQTRLTPRWGRRLSITVTSLLFALIHLDFVQGAFVLLLGLWLGALTERAGSIWPAIVCHALNNTAATLVAPFDPTGGASVCPRMTMPLIAGAAVVLAACVWYVLRRPVVPVEEFLPVAGASPSGPSPVAEEG